MHYNVVNFRHCPTVRVLSRKILLGGRGGGSFKYVWEGLTQREDFAKSARRDVIENALLSFGRSINLTSREKVSVY